MGVAPCFLHVLTPLPLQKKTTYQQYFIPKIMESDSWSFLPHPPPPKKKKKNTILYSKNYRNSTVTLYVPHPLSNKKKNLSTVYHCKTYGSWPLALRDPIKLLMIFHSKNMGADPWPSLPGLTSIPKKLIKNSLFIKSWELIHGLPSLNPPLALKSFSTMFYSENHGSRTLTLPPWTDAPPTNNLLKIFYSTNHVSWRLALFPWLDPPPPHPHTHTHKKNNSLTIFYFKVHGNSV